MLDLGGDVTGNGISNLVFTILSAVAEAERDRIRERIVTVKADQRAPQRYLGGRVPFGWRVDGDGGLIEVPAEQGAIQTMVKMKLDGLALRTIAERMTAQGFKLTHQGVKKIVGRLAEQV